MRAPAAARKPRENRTRYVVLGMLTTGPLTGYGLRQRIAGSVGHFWQESYGQLYPTLRRLAEEGLVEARAARGGPGRPGAIYHLTPRGRAALAAWLALPPVLEPERNEMLLKVFFAGAGSPEATAANLGAVAAAMRAAQAELRAIAARFGGAPPRHPDAPFWRLTLQFGLDFYGTTLEWIERAQRVLRAEASRRRRTERRPTPRPRRAAAAPPRAREAR